MTPRAYASAASCVQGERLTFHVSGGDGAIVVVEDAVRDVAVLASTVDGPTWTLRVPAEWPSSLYRVRFGVASEVYFVVRAARPTAPVLLSVPSATRWPDRAARVCPARPGGGAPARRRDGGLMRWLDRHGYAVDYCSDLDLHGGGEMMSAYRLLVVDGHDGYRSMRGAAEEFARHGGNIAFFTGDTCRWRTGLAGDRRTAVHDPDPATDPTFRAGCGEPGVDRTPPEAYTVRFADHWAFEGTGLSDGDTFARDAIGCETDAVSYHEVDGVPRVTGRDGTPPSFVILATADPRRGQRGHATMGVFRLGAGTVFHAATTHWGTALGDPVVDRITRNVLDRLRAPRPRDRWEVIGPPADLVALAADDLLYAVARDGTLLAREACGQNLPWRPVGTAGGTVCLAVPPAAAGMPPGLYAATTGGRLVYRDGARWHDVGETPARTVALAACDNGLFAADSGGDLWYLPPGRPVGPPGRPVGWVRVDDAGGTPTVQRGQGGSPGGVVALTAMSGRLYAIDRSGHVRTRLPVPGRAPWTDLGGAAGCTMLAGHAGRLIGTAPGRHLRWRDPV